MNKMKMLLSASALFAAAASFGDIRAVTPTAWNGDPDCWQMKRHNEKMQEVAAGGAKVVFIGDSITHFWETTGKAQLAKYFSEGDMKMLDLGISADRTEHVLWRLDNGELDGYEAKVVCLMIGTNNAGHFSFADEPPTDAILGIREILRRIRAKQPQAKVVLSAIFPRGRDANDPIRRRNCVVNKEIQKFCDGQNVFWLDFTDQYLTKDGVLPAQIAPDFLHPGPVGYEIWYAALKPYIDYALSDGKLPAPANRYASYVQDDGTVVYGNNRAVEPDARYQYEDFLVGNEKGWRLDRTLRNRNQIVASQGEIDLVFLGDSITHYWETNGKECFEKLCETYSILDAGYSSDRTENLLWRIQNGELEGFKTKCVMLMIGTNNSFQRMDRPEDIAAGVRKILDVIAEKQPQAKVLLLPIFPNGEAPTDKYRENNMKVNPLIKEFADGEKVIWVDFISKFLDEKGSTMWILPDGAHPSLEGYKIWMEEVLPHFQKICGK